MWWALIILAVGNGIFTDVLYANYNVINGAKWAFLVFAIAAIIVKLEIIDEKLNGK
jgi:hypothetical protein